MSLRESIEKHREPILLGEIGGYIHMFGKACTGFLRFQAKTANGVNGDPHQSLDHFPCSRPYLEGKELTGKFQIPDVAQYGRLTLKENFGDFVMKYKGRKQPDSGLLRLFGECHRVTSQDEKGVVADQQSEEDMRISTPFGHPAEELKFDPGNKTFPKIDQAQKEADEELAKALERYLNPPFGHPDPIGTLRTSVKSIFHPALSKTLGDTRRPANDVTLWHQSHGVASLYKSALAQQVMVSNVLQPNENNEYDLSQGQPRWRLFGICWNGHGYIARGRKPADILSRQKSINELVADLDGLLERDCPIGNRYYSDLNGAFYTFPGLDDDTASQFISELAQDLIEKVREHTDQELSPFFTLGSRRRTTLTITDETVQRDRIGAADHVAPILSIAEESGRTTRILPGMSYALPTGLATGSQTNGKVDICPSCQLRDKPVNSDRCDTCRKRLQGRLDKWKSSTRETTIWTGEVGDRENRVALLTLRFDLSRWLDGNWINTIWSRTPEDWIAPIRAYAQQDKFKVLVGATNHILPDRLECGEPATLDDILAVLKAAIRGCGLADQEKNQDINAQRLQLMRSMVASAIDRNGLDDFLMRENEMLTGVLNTIASPSFYARHLFAQPASPGRLTRVWQETEHVIECWLEQLASEKLLGKSGTRLSFHTTRSVPGVSAQQTYQIEVPDLLPDRVSVVCPESTDSFLTIESLEKYRYRSGNDREQVTGWEAVQQALQNNGITAWIDEDSGVGLTDAAGTVIDQGSVDTDTTYDPVIVLAQSPVFCQVLVPANGVIQALQALTDMLEKRFSRVQGKLPVHIGLLVANRRFPLYSLIETGQQILNDPSRFAGRLTQHWSVPDTTDDLNKFYGQFPTCAPRDDGWYLEDLVQPDAGTDVWLQSGYFDFDLIRSTADRHRFNYATRPSGEPVRPSISYGRLTPRPIPTHLLKHIFCIWNLLTSSNHLHLSSSELSAIEAALSTRLDKWRTVDQDIKPVYNGFADAVLQNEAGNRWHNCLNGESRMLLEDAAKNGLLLETLELYRHVLRVRPPKEHDNGDQRGGWNATTVAHEAEEQGGVAG